jgi:hypothetical protein
MRFVKFIAFYIVFILLCTAIVLGTMRCIASRAGGPGVFNGWVSDIKDAFREAHGFVSRAYERNMPGNG